LIHVDRWAELPPQYKALFEEARPIAQAAAKKAYAEADEKNLPLFRKKLQFIKFTPDELAAFRKAGAEPVWEDWVKLRGGQGIPRPRAAEFPAHPGRDDTEILT
jgi:TRAP-type C4-dicarboxylate transport system substrate-binding protein